MAEFFEITVFSIVVVRRAPGDQHAAGVGDQVLDLPAEYGGRSVLRLAVLPEITAVPD